MGADSMSEKKIATKKDKTALMKALAKHAEKDYEVEDWVRENDFHLFHGWDADTKKLAFVLVHDGGPMWDVMNNEYGYSLREKVEEIAKKHGFYLEDHASWACFVVPEW